MKPALAESSLYLTPERWGRTFIDKLLQITHKQWMYRNSEVHYKLPDGMTLAEHDKVFERVSRLLQTDPEDLLLRHQHLLEVDREALGEATAQRRKYWIADMESAVASKQHATERQVREVTRVSAYPEEDWSVEEGGVLV